MFARSVGAHFGHRERKPIDHPAFLAEDALAIGRLEELDVFGEHAVGILCIRILGDDPVNEMAQLGLTMKCERLFFVDKCRKPRYVQRNRLQLGIQ